MHSSKILRFAADKGFLVPPRTSMDIFASAANAVINLFVSEDKRKLFAHSVNRGVILPEILGQANLGYLRILALYDELDSPTLKSFNVDEFLEGVKPALAELHKVQASLQNKLNHIANEVNDDQEEEENEEEDTVEKAALAAYANAHKDQRLQRLLKYSWKKEAEKNPESDEGRLMSMLTPQLFENFQVGAKMRYFMDPNVEFQDGCVEIRYVALLSARGFLMPSDKAMEDLTIEEAKQKVTDAEEDGAKEEVDSDKLPVAAQVEILYDIEQSLLVPMAKQGDENKTESEEKKTVTRTTVVVGVFEGWLNGDPEGNELRWRVAEVRPAWEFPFLESRGSN